MISILCPTRERRRSVERMLTSIARTAASLVEIVFYIDEEDSTTLLTLPAWNGIRLRAVFGPQITMSDMWNRCAERASGNLLMFVDDEAVFHTPGWDRIVETEFARWPDRAILVHGNDLIHGDVLAAYFFVHRTWLDIFGRLTPPWFSYGYADVWCSEVAQAAGRKIYLPNVVIENMAPKDQPPDHIHQLNQVRAERDRPGDLYNQLQPEREQDVAKLAAYIAEHASELPC